MKHATAMTLTEARTNLLDVAASFERPKAKPIDVTKRGKRVMMLVPAETFDTMVETLEVLADKEAMTAIRRGRADIRAGRTVSLASVRRKMGL
jgi:PHD/YefM family antitoxin component YafN of YafNO toxin-antitoxin module